MRVLIADRLELGELTSMTDAGLTVTHKPDLDADGLVEHLGGVDVLVVRSTKVTETALHAADALSLVIRAGAGTDNIDLAAAADRGIFVSNVPGRNASAVAELTIGLLLAVDRSIVDASTTLRAQRWEKKRFAAADGIREKAIGIYGLGNIGLEVATTAYAMGMKIHVLDRARSDSTSIRLTDMDAQYWPDLVELARNVDVLTLHAPLSDDTLGVVEATVLAALGANGILLNTARAELVDQPALEAALDQGLRVGLDVFHEEPKGSSTDFSHPLSKHQNVIGTPHIGASTDQAQRAIADGVVDVLVRYLSGEVTNCVNLRQARERAATLVIRHHDRPGVLAGVLAVLRSQALNVERMDNRIFEGGTAAIAMIDVTCDDEEGEIGPSLCAALDALDGVIGARLQPAQ